MTWNIYFRTWPDGIPLKVWTERTDQEISELLRVQKGGKTGLENLIGEPLNPLGELLFYTMDNSKMVEIVRRDTLNAEIENLIGVNSNGN